MPATFIPTRSQPPPSRRCGILHALEVELPFLQALLGSFAVVPLLASDTAPQQAAAVLRRLWGGPETLLVVSSDLSHYHDYDTARRLDGATATAIERGNWESLGPDQACGFLAVAGLLVEAIRAGSPRSGSRYATPEIRRARAIGWSATAPGCSR
jgi:AmmeMemoRadiSam system protein B